MVAFSRSVGGMILVDRLFSIKFFSLVKKHYHYHHSGTTLCLLSLMLEKPSRKRNFKNQVGF